MLNFTLFLLLFSVTDTLTLEEISKIEEKRLSFFTVIKNSDNSENLLAIFSKNKNSGRLNIYDSDFSLLISKSYPEGHIYRDNTFQSGNKYYFFSRNLYSIDLETLDMDSITLNFNKYKTLQLFENQRDTILVGVYHDRIQIYDFNTSKLMGEIKTGFINQYDNPVCRDGILVYMNRKNELAGYDMRRQCGIWKVNSGKTAGYFLGIKIGTAEDRFSAYEAVDQNGAQFIYACTFSGALYKIDLNTGEILFKKPRFKGKANNAGLMGSFTLIDMNNDSQMEMVSPSVDHNIYCIDCNTFSVVWEFNSGYENQSPLSFCDITGDGIPEVFGVNDKMKLSIVNGKTGGGLHEMNLMDSKNPWGQTSVILADFNNNGLLDIITDDGKNSVEIFEIKSISVPKNEIFWNPDF